jgi:RimJ/RimL family protein N-acetyltransferase
VSRWPAPGAARPWLAPPPAAARARVEGLAALLPRFETPRLVLRGPVLSDWEVLEPVWTERRSWTPDGGIDPEEAWLDFCQLVASWPLRGYGPLTITGRADGAVLGMITIDHEYGDPEPELGWFLVLAAEGQGYATEAARAVLAWMDALFGPGGWVIYTSDNPRSSAVAVRLGARRDPVAEAEIAAMGEVSEVWRIGERP